MGSQLYSLSWGEFGTSLTSAVQLLRCHGDLVDVTIAAGGRSFPAHKVVLSAASPFLMDLLKSTPCQHPVVMLAGVTAHDLEALLEFVYRGEVSVDPNQLPSLLQAAHCLNIQGLAPGTINSENICNLQKIDDVCATPSSHEALTRDVINSFLPIRRRRKTKRRDSTGSGSGSGSSGPKWARHDGMSADLENQPTEHHSSNSGHLQDQDILSIPDVVRKNEDGESSNHSADETSIASSGGTKIRGASDQPGACPLCGALLRQARNLRRHLLTSCKYRLSGAGVGPSYQQQPSSLEPEVQLQQSPSQQPVFTPLLPPPHHPASPPRPLILQGQQHQQSPQPQLQPSGGNNPMRTVLLHVHHQLPPEERALHSHPHPHLPLPVPLLTPLHHQHPLPTQQQPQPCEQVICKVSPVPSASPGPAAPGADLVSTSATDCREMTRTPPALQQEQ